MRRLAFIALLVLLGLGVGKVIDYYLENRLYFHYLLDSYLETRKSVVKDGYTDQTSYNPGEQQDVFLNAATASKAKIRLYDINGNTVDSVIVKMQPQKPGQNPAEEGFGYSKTFSYKVPALESGLYLWEKKIPFILKAKSKADVVVLYPSNTVNAYNIAGGKSLYKIFSEQTHIVSFKRPTFPAVSFFAVDGLKWLKSTTYSKRYINDQDLEKAEALKGAKVLVITGHSEYWTRAARENVDTFVNGGGHLLVLSGNTMWWQVRYNKAGTALICYKMKPDPVNEAHLRTISWGSTQLSYPLLPSIGVSFRNAGYGRKYIHNFGGYKIVNPASPVLQGVPAQFGDVLRVSTKEYDGAPVVANEGKYDLDNSQLNFYKAELIGYDRAADVRPGIATFIVFQKTPTSGVVVNTASTDWCGPYGMGGPDGESLKKITDNVLQAMLSNKSLFTATE